jgi:hypothetical protein
VGDRGCLSIFGDNQETHRMLAEHLTAEYFIKTEGRGSSVDERKQPPDFVTRSIAHFELESVGISVIAFPKTFRTSNVNRMNE